MSYPSSPAYRASQGFGSHRHVTKLILTNGQSHRSVSVTPLMISCIGVLVAGVLIWCLGLSGYFFFRDDVLRAMIRKHSVTVEQYEDRITGLRLQVDSIRSRQFINQDSFVGVIEDLRERQSAIEAYQNQILATVERAKHAGVDIKDLDVGRSDPIITGSISSDKIQSVSDHSVTLSGASSIGDQAVSRPAISPREALSLSDMPDTSLTRVVRQVDEELRALSYGQSEYLNAIETELANRARVLGGVFDRANLDSRKFAPEAASIGGPFIPAVDAVNLSPLSLQLARIDQTLQAVDALDQAVSRLPVRRPLGSGYSISSRFGHRLDPFLRRRAFHSGLDFRAPTGASVKTTAAGKVTKAGRNGGYGRMVEVSHGNGLSTRYAHLSRISVKVGQRISAGTIVGRVGSTGRSTGPHLHYETRINGKAVDPMRFLTAL